jgi:hypothetical protein
MAVARLVNFATRLRSSFINELPPSRCEEEYAQRQRFVALVRGHLDSLERVFGPFPWRKPPISEKCTETAQEVHSFPQVNEAAA